VARHSKTSATPAPNSRTSGLDGAASGRFGNGSGSPEQEYDRAREICLSQLSYSARTRAQLADAMKRRGVDEAVAADVLSRFEAVGLIDDEAFATAWVDSRHRGRGIGPRKIAHELRRRGIAAALAASSVESITPEEQRAAARAIVARRLTATRGLPSALRAQRLVGMLARKGYPPAIAYEVVRETLAAEGVELPEPAEPIDLADPSDTS
jgi:regulatory protein